jgi:hydroxymethylbilane synthase
VLVSAKVISFGCLNTQLAKDQTKVVLDRLQEANPRLTCRLEVVPSPVAPEILENESFLAASAAEVEFLEDQLLADEFRLAVIRAQDLVLPLRQQLAYAAIPHRDTPFDAFLTRRNAIIDDMPDASVIGVLNLRSRTQMQALWPHLDFRLLRGGMQGALEALLRRCELDGLVAPAAVAEHLGLQGIVAEIFNPELILPSGGQGIMVILGRAEDLEVRELLAPLHSEETQREMEAEHSFLQRFASDLELPVGVLARCTGSRLVVTGAVGSSAAATAALQQREGPAEQAAALGTALAEAILQSDEALIGLLEAEFPEGLPGDDEDEVLETDPDVAVLREFPDLDNNER